jgi:lipid-A-disaccharide synthase-like uncharacterized protein
MARFLGITVFGHCLWSKRHIHVQYFHVRSADTDASPRLLGNWSLLGAPGFQSIVQPSDAMTLQLKKVICIFLRQLY